MKIEYEITKRKVWRKSRQETLDILENKSLKLCKEVYQNTDVIIARRDHFGYASYFTHAYQIHTMVRDTLNEV